MSVPILGKIVSEIACGCVTGCSACDNTAVVYATAISVAGMVVGVIERMPVVEEATFVAGDGERYSFRRADRGQR